jgi:hypothetical protein
MRKQVIEYTSPLDAFIALTKQLNVYEIKYQMSSEDFFAKYSQGETSESYFLVVSYRCYYINRSQTTNQ